MIKKIKTIKLIRCVNEVSNCVQIYVTKCLIIKIDCIPTPGYILRIVGQMCKIGV